jgi:site-specific DNA-methyltransferase (adenine-specific)
MEAFKLKKTDLRVSDITEWDIYSASNCALSEVYLMDCIAGMKHYPDKFFDLAVVDPPYGIGAGGKSFINGTSKTQKNYYKENDWDTEKPSLEYFTELVRVSKNQIVWGGNYFPCLWELGGRCFIFWDKTIHGNSYADGELAWTSFDQVARYYRKNIAQVNSEGRIHPTQKPVKLYEWIFQNYAEEGNLILDTHLGSGSSRIAANKAGLDFVGFEIDEDYFNASEERFKKFVLQTRLF